jgi:hypothetical protein
MNEELLMVPEFEKCLQVAVFLKVPEQCMQIAEFVRHLKVAERCRSLGLRGS